MTPHDLTVTGLVLNTVGALMIWRWGFPQPPHEEGVALGLEDGTVFEDGTSVAEINQQIAERRRFYKFWSNVGAGLLVLGFIIQLWALMT